MKIALGQMLVVPGGPESNITRMKKMIAAAKETGADLITFPEMCIGGYLLGDSIYLNDNYCLELMIYNNEVAIAAAQHEIAVAYGNIYLEIDINERLESTWWGKRAGYHPNHDGRRRRYNAVYVFDHRGQPAERKALSDCLLPKGITIKTNLPNYRFFDDERYFFSMSDHIADFGVARNLCYFPFALGKNNEFAPGFVTCEDLWCEDYRLDGKSVNPTKWLMDNAAEAVINLSASPWTYGKHGARDRRSKKVIEEVKTCNQIPVPMYYVNCVGVQNNGKNYITFDGGSTVYDPNGSIVATIENAYEENLLVVDNKSLPAPFERKEGSKVAEKYLAIKTAIKSFVKTKMVNGVSGGIDSCVTQALYADALGPENVIGINMPSRFNGETTRSIAQQLCENLGTRYHIVPIEDLAERTRNVLTNYMISRPETTFKNIKVPEEVDQNLQAKTRAIQVLSNIAQIEGAMYSNNGNKVELAIGYFTLDADGRGSFAPLGDLTKEEVFEMGHYLNDVVFKKMVIPQAVFDIAPSAELATGQVDPIKVGYHCRILDLMTNYKITSISEMLQWWLEGSLHQHLGLDLSRFESFGATNGKTFVEDLVWFYSREHNQTFKRVQSVPLVVTSKTAYGFDRRESILPSYSLSKRATALAELIKIQGKYIPVI